MCKLVRKGRLLCHQANERQTQRSADALYLAEHPPKQPQLEALAAQQSALVNLGDRLNQGSARERVMAWKKVRRVLPLRLFIKHGHALLYEQLEITYPVFYSTRHTGDLPTGFNF